MRKAAASQGHGRPTINGVAQLHAGKWALDRSNRTAHTPHACREFLPGSNCTTCTADTSNKPPPSLCWACGPLKLIDRPRNVLSSTFWQVAVENVPRTCPTELYSTGIRIARFLVLRPRSRPPGQIPGVCLATSYSDPVWSDSEHRPCCLPAAGLVPSLLPKTIFIMAALSSSRLLCTFRSLPEPHPPWD